jgi:hypothetical protein
MTAEMTYKKDVTICIEEIMSMLRTEDRDMLLNRIESLLYTRMHEEDILDMHAGFVEDYPEMFPEQYTEIENTNDFYENGDPDDCDPAGGYGLNSHI